MSRTSPHHHDLDELGVGKCSVPMFSGGCPDGFCDAPAYGKPVPSARFGGWDGRKYRMDGRYDGYVPGLACVGHGGPSTRVFKDGNAFCAVHPNFVNLQESPAGFGDSVEAARAALATTGVQP